MHGNGTRLPSIIDLVQEFGIAATTAAKALRLLVKEGLAELSAGIARTCRWAVR